MDKFSQRCLVFLLFSLLLAGLLTFQPVKASENSWLPMAPMPAARSGLGVAVVNGMIYAIGGASPSGIVGTNDMYNPYTNTWTTMAPMPTPRTDFGIAAYQGKIYCIGGDIGANKTGPVGATVVTGANEVYNPATNTWQTKTPMPTPRMCLNANVANNEIYLIGGCTSPSLWVYGVLANNEVYDPANDSWSTKAPVPNPVFFYASVSLGNKIYIIGGTQDETAGSNFNQIYDSLTDTWTTGSPIPNIDGYVGRWGMSAGAITDNSGASKIYLVAGIYYGYDSPVFINETDVYDVASDTWANAELPMPTVSFGAGIAALNDSLYVMGGEVGNAPSNQNLQFAPLGNAIIPPTYLLAPSVHASAGTVDQGQASSLTSSAMTTGTSPYTYQWFSEAPGNFSYMPIANATASSYNFSTTKATATGNWGFIIQVTDDAKATVNSTATTVQVNTALALPSVHASAGTVDQGQSSNLASTFVTTGTSPYSYRWFSKAPGAISYSAIDDATSDSYNFSTSSSTAKGNWKFMLQVTDSAGAALNSTAIRITVDAPGSQLVWLSELIILAVGVTVAVAFLVSTLKKRKNQSLSKNKSSQLASITAPACAYVSSSKENENEELG
jgi:N-acetylneuraminic acid mutarotase